MDLRFLFLQAHYRSKQNFTWKSIESASAGLDKIKKRILEIKEIGQINEFFKNKFLEKIEDDFNTPEAVAIMYEVLKSDIKDEDKKATILDFDKIFGLKLNEKEKELVLSDEILKF